MMGIIVGVVSKSGVGGVKLFTNENRGRDQSSGIKTFSRASSSSFSAIASAYHIGPYPNLSVSNVFAFLKIFFLSNFVCVILTLFALLLLLLFSRDFFLG